MHSKYGKLRNVLFKKFEMDYNMSQHKTMQKSRYTAWPKERGHLIKKNRPTLLKKNQHMLVRHVLKHDSWFKLVLGWLWAGPEQELVA